VNVPTGEFRALVERVGQLEADLEEVRDEFGVLRTFDELRILWVNGVDPSRTRSRVRRGTRPDWLHPVD
jgi:hypothetical protein